MRTDGDTAPATPPNAETSRHHVPTHARPAVTQEPDRFTAYGPSHWAVLAVFTVGALTLTWLRRAHRGPTGRALDRGFALLLLSGHVGALVYTVLSRSGQPLDAIPLHLSDLAGFVAAYALWTHTRWAYALTYYWCLSLSSQALVSPVLAAPDFPHHEFLTFWGLHLLVIWCALWLTWGAGLRPTWRHYRIAATLTAIWAATTMVFNGITGTNYGYLNRKPDTGSVLDLLGPWPWYVLAEVTVILAVWALLTWPWTSPGSPRHGTAATGTAA